MVKLKDLVNYAEQLMQADRFKDYCPNGLQVQGKAEIRKIVTGVTASMALLEAAKSAYADLILVHHGYFWRNEDDRIVGIKRNRISFLLKNDINLMAYHLPLDAHGIYGNNVQLGQLLDVSLAGFAGEANMVAYGSLAKHVTLREFSEQVSAKLHRTPLVMGDLDKVVSRIAWCTGAAQGYMDVAINLGVDVFLTGEVSEQITHLVLESGVAYIAAGHHATERYGVQALGEHLAEQFNIEHEFIDIRNDI